MHPLRHIRRLAGVLAGLAAALVAFGATPAFASQLPPEPAPASHRPCRRGRWSGGTRFPVVSRSLTWLTIRGFRRAQGCDLWFRWFRRSVLRTSPGF
jgi:hypothetical protein